SSSLLLQGKRILITGGGRGIGRSIAVICYQEGANVIITSRTKQELEETIRIATTTNTESRSSSESSSNNVSSSLSQIVDASTILDIVINNAGGAQTKKGPIGTLESNDFESLFKLNVLGPQLITSTIMKYNYNKIIVNISSKAGKIGIENMSHYVATKFALEGLTSSWSKELYSQGIRVHSISPGMINT
ncbi:NAD(P)-binding protein, partial [Fragilariopsis cylindrus CCMP1102]